MVMPFVQMNPSDESQPVLFLPLAAISAASNAYKIAKKIKAGYDKGKAAYDKGKAVYDKGKAMYDKAEGVYNKVKGVMDGGGGGGGGGEAAAGSRA